MKDSDNKSWGIILIHLSNDERASQYSDPFNFKCTLNCTGHAGGHHQQYYMMINHAAAAQNFMHAAAVQQMQLQQQHQQQEHHHRNSLSGQGAMPDYASHRGGSGAAQGNDMNS